MPIDAKSKMEISTNIAIVISSSRTPQTLLLVNMNLIIMQIPVGVYFHDKVALIIMLL